MTASIGIIMYQQLLMKPASTNSVLGKLQRTLLGYGRQGKGVVETTLADGNVTRCISSGRSRRGLYDGKDIRTGNLVSFSNKKTKRKFRPNVIKKVNLLWRLMDSTHCFV